MQAEVFQNEHFISYACQHLQVPILLASPHSGRNYPAEILNNLRIPVEHLLRLEDRYCDILVRSAAAQNIPTIIAKTPRTIIDLNRAEDEIDADMIRELDWSDVAHPSAKTRGGLGLIPRKINKLGEIWKSPISKADLYDRIDKIHKPYHDYIAAIMQKMKQKFGMAILLDIHSMPPLTKPLANGKIAQWVIGDRFGASADNIYSDLITAYLQGHGFDIALNIPYSGDFILERHSKPSKQCYALQIEISRDLYLDYEHREPNVNVEKIALVIKGLVDYILEYINQTYYLEAAE